MNRSLWLSTSYLIGAALLWMGMLPGWSRNSLDWLGYDMESGTNVVVERPACLAPKKMLRVQFIDLGESHTITVLNARPAKQTRKHPALYLDISDLDTGNVGTLVMPRATAPPFCN